MDATATAERPKDDLSDLQLSPEEAERELDEIRRTDPERAAALEAERAAALEAAQADLDGEKPAAVSELEQEAGPAVGAMPPNEPEDAGAVSGEIVVTGTQPSPGKWAGKAANEVTIALKGAKFKAHGGFKKGELFTFTGSARVVSEGVKDKLDKDTRLPSEAVQEHQAVVLDFEITSD